MIAVLALALCTLSGDLAALKKKLEDPSERERHAAVVELAKLESTDAWQLVIRALGDPEPMVADQAETELARVHEPKLVAELCGRHGLQHRDPWVQIHAAGALARLEAPIDPSLLVPGLDTKHAEASRRLLAAIEVLGRAKRFAGEMKLERKLAYAIDDLRDKAKDPEISAWCQLARFRLLEKDEFRPEITRLKKAPGPGNVAILSVAAEDGWLQEFPESERETARLGRELLALEMLRSDLRPVRWEASDLLARHADAGVARALVTALAAEKNLRLAWHIADHLERLSGRPSALEVESWKQWADGLNDDWKPTAETPPARPSAEDTATLVGMPVLSDQLAILIDFSSSLWEKRADGKTRKEIIGVELKKTLESLTPETLFNLVPYTETPIPWEKRLVRATPHNVNSALAFFEDCKATGKGAFWEAAMLALQDPEVDTILVLTGGAPSGGKRWHLDRIGEHYAIVNRFRHVVLDALLVDSEESLQAKWATTCAASGGRMLTVELK